MWNQCTLMKISTNRTNHCLSVEGSEVLRIGLKQGLGSMERGGAQIYSEYMRESEVISILTRARTNCSTGNTAMSSSWVVPSDWQVGNSKRLGDSVIGW